MHSEGDFFCQLFGNINFSYLSVCPDQGMFPVPRLRLRNATFDGIAVRFRKRDFDHCFFESSRRDGGKVDFEHLPPERLVADIVAKEERILAIMAESGGCWRGGAA